MRHRRIALHVSRVRDEEHVVAVVLPVARLLPQAVRVHERRGDFVVAALPVLRANQIGEALLNAHTVRQQHRRAGRPLVEEEESAKKERKAVQQERVKISNRIFFTFTHTNNKQMKVRSRTFAQRQSLGDRAPLPHQCDDASGAARPCRQSLCP